MPAKDSCSYHGRPDGYTEFRVIEPGGMNDQAPGVFGPNPFIKG